MKKGILLAVIVLALASLGVYYWLAGGRNPQSTQTQGFPPAAVSVVTVEPQEIPMFDELPGRVTAHKVAEIRPQVSGIITRRLFEEGSEVKAGQQLYQIDPALYKAAYNSAQATLQKARANLKSAQTNADRYVELIEANLVSRQQYDSVQVALEQAKADVSVAEAAVASAEINLNYTKVYAPIFGRVGKSFVTEGALVIANQTQTLTRITQLDPIHVDLTQASANLIRMREQLKARQDTNLASKTVVSLSMEGGRQPYPHKGVLQFSDVTVDETTGSVTLRALFPNPDHTLLPGLFVRARIELGTQQAILVPQQAAIRRADGELNVWKVGADNTVNPVVIKADQEIGDKWLVRGGLRSGDVIVVAGFQRIAPGAKVTPSPLATHGAGDRKNAAQ